MKTPTINDLDRTLTPEEQDAIQQAAILLENAFGTRMYLVSVKPDDRDPTTPWGIQYAFTLTRKATRTAETATTRDENR